MQNLTIVLHNLFCRLDHLERMEELKTRKHDESACLFYLEQVFEDPFAQRDHLLWSENAKNLLGMLK